MATHQMGPSDEDDDARDSARLAMGEVSLSSLNCLVWHGVNNRLKKSLALGK